MRRTWAPVYSFDLAAFKIRRVSSVIELISHHRDWLAARIVIDGFSAMAGLDQ
jgi:hypothetical protein